MTFGFKLRKLGAGILPFLLIVALVMATLPDYASASPARRLATPSERPAGCHGHGGTSPDIPPIHSSPLAPISHQCCLTGHDMAVVPASYHTLPSPQLAQASLQVVRALSESSFNELDVSMALSADPPGMTQLRI